MDKFQRAITLHREGKLALARAAYEEVLRVQPGHAAALHSLGIVAHQMGDAARAAALIGEATRLDPGDAFMPFHLGNALRDLRDHAAALASYTRAIGLKPDFAEAYALRGIVACEMNERQAALRDYDAALALRADFAEVHSNRGDVLRELGRHAAALASLERAIALRPDFPEALCNRGLVLLELGQRDAALASLDLAIALSPAYAAAHYNRGLVLKQLRRWDMALASFERALAIRPDDVEIHRSRGILLKSMQQFDAALASLDAAITLDPGFAPAYSSRGTVLHELNRFEAALEDYDRAIALQPELAEAHLNRGATLRECNQLQAALASYERAIALDPQCGAAHSNRATVLTALGDAQAAVASCDAAIALDGSNSAAHLNKAMALLLLGQYEDGWIEYEWRWAELDHASDGRLGGRNFPRPLWLGEELLADKTILLHAEQGLGDTIQFCRYARLVADLGATVILEVPAQLATLLRGLPGVARIVVRGEPLPPFDLHCPLLSLPLAFRTVLSTVPANVPYLRPDPDKSRHWRAVVGERRGLRVGVVWSGGFRPLQRELWTVNARRNIPLEKLAPLSHPSIEFFSLQVGQPAEGEWKELIARGWTGLELVDHVASLQDFSDTSALIDQLDLVISVDTSTAHLAAAQGRPVWLLNRHDTCWRWLQDRTDSPWYPTMKIYRQPSAGNWDEVIERVRADLFQLVDEGRSTSWRR